MPRQPSTRAPSRATPGRPAGPGEVRAVALALPALAALAGYLLPRSRAARTAVRLGALFLPAGAAGLVLAAGPGRRGQPEPMRCPSAHSRGTAPGQDPASSAEAMVTVIVPARDEAAVIARLIADLGAARSDPMTLLVVDDASCDGMAELACAAIARSGLADVARVTRLATPSGSKGAALAAIPIPASGVLVVLDADARVAPDFVARVRTVGAVAPAAQARRRMLRPAAGCPPGREAALLALMQDGEQEVDGLIARARLRVGGATEFRGDGMVIRAGALAALGGWPSDALCEDLELATRWYLATGRGVERPAGLEIWEQPVLSLRPLFRQRLRWAEGSIRRDLRLVIPALFERHRPVRRRVELAAYASQALMPAVVLGMAAQALRRPAEPRCGHGAETSVAARRTLGVLASGYALAALILAWGSQPDESEQPDEPAQPREARRAQQPASVVRAMARSSGTTAPGWRRRAGRWAHADRFAPAVAVTAFTGLWVLVLPVAWLRVAARPGSPRFTRTPHEAPARFNEPGSGPPQPI
ncbi:MAG: glycosyltransferase family 2 protein [Candidatus Limnocylindrales bacterium]